MTDRIRPPMASKSLDVPSICDIKIFADGAVQPLLFC